ncbi:MAG: phage/plasmid primase, P4 family, partial [Alphaproteobacteria bacterium]|nr:phage/plasmid primase, P4 family [Alphaproteobacteria bacterium]
MKDTTMSDTPERAARLAEEKMKPKIRLADARPPEFSDEALAHHLVERNADGLCYVAAWRQWYAWTGSQWEMDTTLDVFDKARAVCRAAASEADKPHIMTALASAKTVASVERLARSDRRVAAVAEQWDADPDMCNAQTVTINLKTGEQYAPRPEDYCTKIMPVAPGGDCPLWRSFLNRVTNNDTELQGYLARLVGYCLTGHTHEHALFFMHGTGANGKSVFIDTIAGMMGGYATTAPIETFLAARGDRHPTELAALRGARLVVADETDQGRHWNEGRLKQLTGGGDVSARFVRQDFFTFKPTCKILIVGNHKPSIRAVDEAMSRRFHLIPFDVTIPKDERDLHLAEKLKDEWGGILQWAVDGCLAWRNEGLNPPAAVREATDQYLVA